MVDTIRAIAVNLDEVLADIQFSAGLRFRLAKVLAESEGRFDMEFRKGDFGSIVRRRRVKATSAIRGPSGQVIEASNTEGDLPVKSGRFVAGWNWKFRGLNASVSSQVPYASYAHKVDESKGEGLRVVTEWLGGDWSDVIDEMESVIEDHLNGAT